MNTWPPGCRGRRRESWRITRHVFKGQVLHHFHLHHIGLDYMRWSKCNYKRGREMKSLHTKEEDMLQWLWGIALTIGEPENKESQSLKKRGNEVGTCYKEYRYNESPLCPEVVQGVSALTKSSIQIQPLASTAQRHFKRLEDNGAQGQAQLLRVIKGEVLHAYNSGLLTTNDLGDTGVLVLWRSFGSSLKRWNFSYHQLRAYPSMKSGFFLLFWKSILFSCKGRILLHFRQRAVKQEGSLTPRAEQRRQVHHLHRGGSMGAHYRVSSNLGADFGGVRRVLLLIPETLS